MSISRVVTTVISHHQQRYETVGDWFYNPQNNTLWIYVSDMKNWKYHLLVAMHEQTEAMLCMDRGIEEKQVTFFDLQYEEGRKQGKPDCQGEPGDHPNAPYRKEHFFATSIERLLAAELDVDWEEYDKAVMAL